ncbi:hypothetical protein RHGRI_010209 [Rhododendron griersonianum]|uniref:Uncharacterized protein n=1 Tax=Rhododendron griersonianum TaxID=479676 RepID=A0AAV6KHR8_9ERIC|nr:hypothetical protein RHGRI_010209 [Rhododendron griersonianum]
MASLQLGPHHPPDHHDPPKLAPPPRRPPDLDSDKEMTSAVIAGNDQVTGHIISTTIGGKNGEPKQVGFVCLSIYLLSRKEVVLLIDLPPSVTISYMAERVVGTGSFGIVFQVLKFWDF